MRVYIYYNLFALVEPGAHLSRTPCKNRDATGKTATVSASTNVQLLSPRPIIFANACLPPFCPLFWYVALGIGRSLTLLLKGLRLLQLLSCDQSLVLSLELVAVPGELIRLAVLGPESIYRESIVEIRAKVVHDANWEHDIHAKLLKKFAAVSACTSYWLAGWVGAQIP